jgi:arylsulfatase A-like enzyme
MYVRPDDFDRRDAKKINRDVLRWFHHRSPRPFYLFINYFDVHGPYIAPMSYASRFGQASPWLLAKIDSVMAIENYRVRHSAEETESLITAYDNCLAFLDNSVGELLDSLSRLPGWGNTIVIITSDHGEAFGEHSTYGHGDNLYREVLHVPLIILGPNIPAGLRTSHLVGIQELFETVLQLSGMDSPPFQRASLRRFWQPGFEPGISDEFVVSELSPDPETMTSASISLTTPEWQYFHDAGGKEELYRAVSDPREVFNLAKSPEYQKVLKDLQIQLRATVNESLRPWRGPQYMSGLGGSDHTLANAVRLSSELDSGSAPPPRIPIGTAQAFFPRRRFTSTQRPLSMDQELLRSLPYH